MIIEHEFLEQILEEDWLLARSASFIESLGKNGWTVLYQHWSDGNVELISGDDTIVPDWRAQEILRAMDSEAIVSVRCTEKGSRIV